MGDLWVMCSAFRGQTRCPANAPAVYEWKRRGQMVRLALCASHADDLLPLFGPPHAVIAGTPQSIH